MQQQRELTLKSVVALAYAAPRGRLTAAYPAARKHLAKLRAAGLLDAGGAWTAAATRLLGFARLTALNAALEALGEAGVEAYLAPGAYAAASGLAVYAHPLPAVPAGRLGEAIAALARAGVYVPLLPLPDGFSTGRVSLEGLEVEAAAEPLPELLGFEPRRGRADALVPEPLCCRGVLAGWHSCVEHGLAPAAPAPPLVVGGCPSGAAETISRGSHPLLSKVAAGTRGLAPGLYVLAPDAAAAAFTAENPAAASRLLRGLSPGAAALLQAAGLGHVEAGGEGLASGGGDAVQG